MDGGWAEKMAANGSADSGAAAPDAAMIRATVAIESATKGVLTCLLCLLCLWGVPHLFGGGTDTQTRHQTCMLDRNGRNAASS